MRDQDFLFKKSLGQNFLQDANILKKIVTAGKLDQDTLVLEVGPGSGNLTQFLAKEAKEVVAYEIDERLKPVLDMNLKETNNVTIIFDDFLKRDVKEDLQQFSYQHLAIVANLPYYITTPIITKVLEENLPVEKMVVMVQKEVGDRFAAVPGQKDYSSLSVYLHYFFEVKKEFIVSRNAFLPKPNVDSIVVSFIRKEQLLPLKNRAHFFRLVRDSFQYKRKTLRNNLKSYPLDQIEAVLKEYHFDLSVRAEQLPMEVFVQISNRLA